MVKGVYRLYGKPYERDILRALCEKNNATLTIDEATMLGTVRADSTTILTTIRRLDNKIINAGIKALAFAQAENRFADLPVQTLNSNFWQGFSNTIVAIIRHEDLTFVANNDAQLVGVFAAGKLEFKDE